MKQPYRVMVQRPKQGWHELGAFPAESLEAALDLAKAICNVPFYQGATFKVAPVATTKRNK